MGVTARFADVGHRQVLDHLAVALAGLFCLPLIQIALQEASWAAFYTVVPIAIASVPLVVPSRMSRMISASAMGLLCVALIPAFGIGFLFVPAFAVMVVAALRRSQ